MDTLLLITCCKSKRQGGDAGFQPPTFLREYLSFQSFSRLMKLRSDLARLLGLLEGPDLGGRFLNDDIEYMPAFERYSGRMYTTSKFQELYPHRNEMVDVLIVSALYGILHPEDLIRNYELAMECRIPGKSKVGTWWRNYGLEEMLCEVVENLRVRACHDLLSKSYRRVLQPWPSGSLEGIITIHGFPGQGFGSVYRRGEIINHLLKGNEF